MADNDPLFRSIWRVDVHWTRPLFPPVVSNFIPHMFRRRGDSRLGTVAVDPGRGEGQSGGPPTEWVVSVEGECAELQMSHTSVQPNVGRKI